MIKTLRRKLLFLMMTGFTLIILFLIAFIVGVPERQKKNEIRRSLESFSLASPALPVPPEEKRSDGLFRAYGGIMLLVETDGEGNITSYSCDRRGYYSDDDLSDILSIIRKSGDDFGYRKGYYYLMHTTPDGFSYTILDCTSSVNDLRRSVLWGIIGGCGAWILLFLLSLKLTAMMVKPVSDAFEKQNQFISDVSHELKTPIAVIEANADVLRQEKGESRWLDYITTEAGRMDRLVKDLLYLMSVTGKERENSRIDFSRLIEGTVLPFEALAWEKGITIECDIMPSLFVRGNEGEMEKLVSILLSNALKYSYDNTTVHVLLAEKHRSVFLRVRNEGEGVRAEDREKIFERFWRVDKSRQRSDGSYGLGLAMAKTIASNHHARLCCESEYGSWAEFIFEMKAD